MLVRILHALAVGSRKTNIVHSGMFSIFKEQAGISAEMEYINPLLTKFDSKIHREPNLTVVTYELLSLRSLTDWVEVTSRIQPFLRKSEKRVGFAQDDYTGAGYLDSFLTEHRFSAVYSPLTNDLNLIYPKFLKMGRVENSLTGYLSVPEGKSKTFPPHDSKSRPTDFFSRIRRLPPYFGDISIKKAELSARLAQGLEKAGLTVDFSTKAGATLLGNQWEAALRRSKATLVAHGGASEVDTWNQTSANFKALQASGISEEWSYRLSKPLRLKRGHFSAVSPRLFEAALAGTVLVCPPSDVLPGMEAWKHYIPYEGKASEVGMIADAITNPVLLHTMAQEAFSLMSTTSDYLYSSFVKSFFERELPQPDAGSYPVQSSISRAEMQIKSIQTAKQNYEQFSREHGYPTWYNIRSIRRKLKRKESLGKRLTWLEQGLLTDEVSYLSVTIQALPAQLCINSIGNQGNK